MNLSINSSMNQAERLQSMKEPTVNVQQQIQNQVLVDSTRGDRSTPQVMLQLLTATQPPAQIQNVAQNQIKKGYLDIKI